jgi:hypothetical protein
MVLQVRIDNPQYGLFSDPNYAADLDGLQGAALDPTANGALTYSEVFRDFGDVPGSGFVDSGHFTLSFCPLMTKPDARIRKRQQQESASSGDFGTDENRCSISAASSRPIAAIFSAQVWTTMSHCLGEGVTRVTRFFKTSYSYTRIIFARGIFFQLLQIVNIILCIE